jgi:hypothetical protein
MLEKGCPICGIVKDFDQRWCPACRKVSEKYNTWECPDCETKLWTHEMIWEHYRDALKLRPQSKGAAAGEAGRLRLDLQRVRKHYADLETLCNELERELSERHDNQLRSIVKKTLQWLAVVAKGSAPLKSVPLADLNKHIMQLRAALKE